MQQGAKKLVGVAVAVALGVAFLPPLLPTGPSSGLQADTLLESGQFFLAGGVIFLAGLLTALTPCVYPLIPITVSVFGARQAESRGRAILLTSAYVVGMGLVFSVLGTTVALSGKAFGSLLGHPGVALGLAVFLAVLASSMFGAFELALPSSLTTKLSQVGGGGVAGALLMGSVSGFLAAPCTGPVLTGLLAFVAKTQNAALGAALLFIYALGIGVPFFLLGVFTVRLPKGGAWMETVKSVLGIALVVLAAVYLRDALAPVRGVLSAVADAFGKVPATTLAAVVAAIGVLLGAIHLSFKAGAREATLKGVGVTLVVFALLVRLSALDSPAHGTLGLSLTAGAAEASEVAWLSHLPASSKTPQHAEVLAHFDEQLAKAQSEGRPVMIDFFAEWCAACKELDRHTYVAPQVVKESSRFLNIKVDGTNEETFIEALYQRYGVKGLPTVVFIGSDGKPLNDPRVTGFLEAERFLTEMQRVR